MKNQYFGDINDYRKYGLLRAIISTSKLRLLVAWMLTPKDERNDGKFISYLNQSDKWSGYDKTLFDTIKNLMANEQVRNVSLIEKTDLLQNAKYFSETVPDSSLCRGDWFDTLAKVAKESEFVFLDPDNGLEVKSKPYGKKYSSKYLYWREVKELWSSGKSLLIYQHFIREKRSNFIQGKLDELLHATSGSLVEAFSTSNVVFLMALQPEHQRFHKKIVSSVQKNWEGQIQYWGQNNNHFNGYLPSMCRTPKLAKNCGSGWTLNRMNKELQELCSGIEGCTKCENLSQAIYPLGKAIGLTYVEPKIPCRVLFVAESPPAAGFFYDTTPVQSPFRNRLFRLINEAGLPPANTIQEFNERGYFLGDAINCRWDKSEPTGSLSKIRSNCSEHLKNLVVALNPQAVVLMGKTAKLSYRALDYSHPSVRLVIEIPFITTTPVPTEVFISELKKLAMLSVFQ